MTLLEEFDELFAPGILERGFDYYAEGRVGDIREVSEGCYRAEVSGSSLYSVTVKLNPDYFILGMTCDCPVDSGYPCKHQAAVLYELNDVLPEELAVSGEESVTKEDGIHDLQEVLNELTKDELVAFLLELSEEEETLAERIKLKFSEEKNELSISKTLLRKHFYQAGIYNFDEIGSEAAEGVEAVINKAENRLEEGKKTHAIKLCLMVYQEMLPVVQGMLYPDGDMEMLMSHTLLLINEAGETIACEDDDHAKKEMADDLLKTLNVSAGYGYDHYLHFPLMEVLGYFAAEPSVRKELEDAVALYINANQEDHYIQEDLKLFQLSLYESFGDKEQAERFTADNLALPAFRKKAIEAAVKQENYSEAERLCLEGEEKDRKWLGLLRDWKMLRYEVYQSSGNKEAQRDLAAELLINGQFDFYYAVKELTGPDEWPKMRTFIIQEMESAQFLSRAYIDFLIVENEKEKLMEYCDRRPGAVTDLYPYLISDYSDEVKRLFIQHIEAISIRTGTRSEYRTIGYKIAVFGKACGAGEAKKLIDHLQQTYNRRPAFKDELEKVRRKLG